MKSCSQLAFMTTTSDGAAAIRLWTQYHRAIGVELFYMFVNGQVYLAPQMQCVHEATSSSSRPQRCSRLCHDDIEATGQAWH